MTLNLIEDVDFRRYRCRQKRDTSALLLSSFPPSPRLLLSPSPPLLIFSSSLPLLIFSSWLVKPADPEVVPTRTHKHTHTHTHTHSGTLASSSYGSHSLRLRRLPPAPQTSTACVRYWVGGYCSSASHQAGWRRGSRAAGNGRQQRHCRDSAEGSTAAG